MFIKILKTCVPIVKKALIARVRKLNIDHAIKFLREKYELNKKTKKFSSTLLFKRMTRVK